MTKERRLLRVAGWTVLALALLPVAYVGYVYTYAWGAGRYWDRAEPEVHLIPSGYLGPVLIIYDSAGAPPEREGKARLYRVPAGGVVRTQFPPNEGWGRPFYYYVDAAGRRTSIVAGTPCARGLPGDPVQACLLGRRYHMSGPNPEYSGYLVGRQQDQRSLNARADSLVDLAVFKMRP